MVPPVGQQRDIAICIHDIETEKVVIAGIGTLELQADYMTFPNLPVLAFGVREIRDEVQLSLIQSGLEREIGESSPAPRHPLRILRTLDATIWKDVRGDDYVSDLRKSWD